MNLVYKKESSSKKRWDKPYFQSRVVGEPFNKNKRMPISPLEIQR